MKTIQIILFIGLLLFFGGGTISQAKDDKVADSQSEQLKNYSYEGDKNDAGQYTGKGKLYYKGKLLYKGEFENNRFDGNGILYYVSKKSKDNENQNVVSNKMKYRGEFRKGQFHGEGELFYETAFDLGNSNKGVQYRGKFLYGQYNGYGTEYQMSGTVNQKGYFVQGVALKYKGLKDKDGLMNGKGKLLNEAGTTIFEGKFVHGVIEGKGTMINDEKTWKYEGDFSDDFMQGQGTVYTNNILNYKGQFYEGLKEGTGKLYLPNGKFAYQTTLESDRTLEQPFQVRVQVTVDSNLKAHYTVDFVLQHKFSNKAMTKYYNDMFTRAKKSFDTVKENPVKSDYVSFTATKAIENAMDKTFVDDFLGFNFLINKRKLMIYEEVSTYSFFSNTLDPNLFNVNLEMKIPKRAFNTNMIGVSKAFSETHILWKDITDSEYRFIEFQQMNYRNIFILLTFAIVLVGGIIYFKKRNRRIKKTKVIKK